MAHNNAVGQYALYHSSRFTWVHRGKHSSYMVFAQWRISGVAPMSYKKSTASKMFYIYYIK